MRTCEKNMRIIFKKYENFSIHWQFFSSTLKIPSGNSLATCSSSQINFIKDLPWFVLWIPWWRPCLTIRLSSWLWIWWCRRKRNDIRRWTPCRDRRHLVARKPWLLLVRREKSTTTAELCKCRDRGCSRRHLSSTAVRCRRAETQIPNQFP